MAETATANPVPTYQADPRLLQARAVIANHLGVPLDDVTVKVGRDPEKDQGQFAHRISPMNNDHENTEELIVTVHKQGLSLEGSRIKEEIRSSLAQIKPLADYAQMIPQEKLATKLLNDLKAATADTNFNQKLFNWPGFNPEIIGRGYEIGDYGAQNIKDTAYGVTMNLHFAHAKGVDVGDAIERFTVLTQGDGVATKGRLEAIKKILTDRVVKYTKINVRKIGLNNEEAQLVEKKAKEKATTEGKDFNETMLNEAMAQAMEEKIKHYEDKVRTDMAKLKITLTRDGDSLRVTLRSPKQEEEYNKADPQMRDNEWQGPPADADVLRNTNPLTSREINLSMHPKAATDTTPEEKAQAPTALARAFFFDEQKNIAPDVLQIFGRSDIKAALIKEIVLRVLPKHPEKKVELEKILSSELFKNHGDWHGQPGTVNTAKLEPAMTTLPNDTVEIAFTLREDKEPAKNQLLQAVNGLVAWPQTQAAQASAQEATAEQIAETIARKQWAAQVGQQQQRIIAPKREMGWLEKITSSVSGALGLN